MEAHAATEPGRAARRHRAYLLSFAGVAGGVLCCFLAIGAVLTILPQYVKGPLGAGDVAVGVVTGAFAVTALVFRPIGGRMADHRGRRFVVVVGMLIASVAGALYLLPLGVPGLVFARFILGIGDGWVFTAGATWIVDMSPPARRGQAIGMFGLAIWSGLTLGPLLGELLKHVSGYDAVFVASAVLPLVGVLIVRRVPDRHRPALDEHGERRPRGPLVPRGVIAPGVALTAANVGFGTMASFIVLHMAQEGVSEGATVFTAFAATVVLGRLALGSLPDRVGPRRTAAAAGVAEAAGLALMAMATGLPLALAGAVVMGTGFSLLFPSLALLALERTDDEQRGSALGAVTAFFDLGVAVGSPLAGLAAEITGTYPAAFWFAAIVGLIGAGISWLLTARPYRQTA